MMRLMLCLLLTLSLSKDIFMIPDRKSDNPHLGLVFIIGAESEPSTYLPLVNELRAQFLERNVDLYVAIPDFLFHTPSPIQIDGKIGYSIQKLEEKSMKENT